MSNLSGKLILIIGPSGVGKGSYIARLKEKHHEWVFPVSVTTRKKRPKEQKGITYYYYTKKQFEKEKNEGKFLEWACVHGTEYYGLLKETVFDALKNGKTIIREIDIQGLESAARIIPEKNLLSIFLLPPSMEILRKRIIKRSPLSNEEIARRMKSAEDEIKKAKLCDIQFQTTNNEIKEDVEKLEKIILKETKS